MDKVYAITSGAMSARALADLSQCGVLKYMFRSEKESGGKSTDVEDAARECKVSADFLYRTLRFLASKDYFEETEYRKFKLTEVTNILGNPDNPAHLSLEVIAGDRGHWMALIEFDDTLRNGHVRKGLWDGMDSCWSYFETRPQDRDRFARFMSMHSKRNEGFIATLFDFSPYKLHCDVGGSEGTLSRIVQSAFPNIKSISYDSPQLIAKFPNTDTITYQGGNFFESVPPAEVYTMKYILHDWEDEPCRVILSNCIKSMIGDGCIVVYDCVIPAFGEDPRCNVYNVDFIMMSVVQGRERKKEEFEALGKSVGLEMVRCTFDPIGRFGATVFKKIH